MFYTEDTRLLQIFFTNYLQPGSNPAFDLTDVKGIALTKYSLKNWTIYLGGEETKKVLGFTIRSNIRIITSVEDYEITYEEDGKKIKKIYHIPKGKSHGEEYNKIRTLLKDSIKLPSQKNNAHVIKQPDVDWKVQAVKPLYESLSRQDNSHPWERLGDKYINNVYVPIAYRLIDFLESEKPEKISLSFLGCGAGHDLGFVVDKILEYLSYTTIQTLFACDYNERNLLDAEGIITSLKNKHSNLLIDNLFIENFDLFNANKNKISLRERFNQLPIDRKDKKHLSIVICSDVLTRGVCPGTLPALKVIQSLSSVVDCIILSGLNDSLIDNTVFKSVGFKTLKKRGFLLSDYPKTRQCSPVQLAVPIKEKGISRMAYQTIREA